MVDSIGELPVKPSELTSVSQLIMFFLWSRLVFSFSWCGNSPIFEAASTLGGIRAPVRPPDSEISILGDVTVNKIGAKPPLGLKGES